MNTALTKKRPSVYDMISHIDRGGTEIEIENAVRKAVQESMQAMKKSKVSIELTFDPDPKTEAMRVSSRVKVVLPEPPKKAALFFPTPDGNLQRHDPQQGRMFEAEASES